MDKNWDITEIEENKLEIIEQLIYFFVDEKDMSNTIRFVNANKEKLSDLSFNLRLEVIDNNPYNEKLILSLKYHSIHIDKLLGFYTYKKFSGDLKKDLYDLLPEMIDEFVKYLGYVINNDESNYVKKEDYIYLEHFKIVNE